MNFTVHKFLKNQPQSGEKGRDRKQTVTNSSNCLTNTYHITRLKKMGKELSYIILENSVLIGDSRNKHSG